MTDFLAYFIVEAKKGFNRCLAVILSWEKSSFFPWRKGNRFSKIISLDPVGVWESCHPCWVFAFR